MKKKKYLSDVLEDAIKHDCCDELLKAMKQADKGYLAVHGSYEKYVCGIDHEYRRLCINKMVKTPYRLGKCDD